MLRRLTRLVFTLLCAAVVLSLGHAQPVAQISHAQAAYPAPVRVLQGMGPDADIAQIAQLGQERFMPFNSAKLYALSPDSVLWLRVDLNPPVATASGAWLLQFPTVIVDRYEFYQRDAKGGWHMQAAGDRVAHSQWPVDALRPSFVLPDKTADAPYVFVRIVHQLPVNLAPVVVQEQASLRHDSTQMLWVGLLVGVVFTLLFTCMQMTLAYRDWTYGWYAGYLFFTMLATLCYSGIAQRLLWPDASKFASDAIVVSVMAAFIFNLQFSRAMFGSLQRPFFHGLAKLLMGMCAAYIVLTLWSQRYGPYILAFHALSLGVFVFIIASAFYAWRRGVVYGGYWLMVYMPYLCAIALTLAQSAGLLSAAFPSQLPIVAALLEAVGMMLCLNGYSRLRHTQTVREQVVAQRDPLTGFLNANAFRSKAAQIWSASERFESDVAVAYVQVSPAETLAGESVDVEAMMARSVRVVRTAVREFDTVGRVGKQRLAIVMTGMPLGDALNGRLSRLVALGLMRDSLAQVGDTLKLSITASVRSQFEGTFADLDMALNESMDSALAGRKVITYVFKPEWPDAWTPPERGPCA